MRRLLTWYLPLFAGIALSVLFAWGFIKGLQGDAGELVRDSTVISRPEDDLGEQNTAVSGKTLILILGDSLARGTGDELGEGIGGRLSTILDQREVDHEIANLAVNGARTEDLLGQLERESVEHIVENAAVVLVSIGGNDFFGETDSFGVSERLPDDPEQVIDPIQERIGGAVSEIRALNPEAMIFVLGLYNPFQGDEARERLSPLIARWNSALLRRLAGDPRVVVVQTSDLFVTKDRLSSDRFHPNGEAYELIARRIADAI